MQTRGRREFCIGGLSLALMSGAWARTSRYPIGLQLYTVYPELQKDFQGTLNRIAAMGFREVELVQLPNRDPRQVRHALQAAGLRAVSIHVDSDALLAEASQQIEAAAAFGVKYLICPMPLISPRVRALPENSTAPASMESYLKLLTSMTMDDWHWSADALNRIGRQVQAAGMQFGYHNHSIEFRPIDGRIPYEELIARTAPDLVSFEMDCGWVESSRASSVEYLRKYPHRFQLLHVKDIKRPADPGVQFEISSTEVGRGVIDWKAILAAAHASGVKHLFVEQEPPYERPVLESVEASYRWLERNS